MRAWGIFALSLAPVLLPAATPDLNQAERLYEVTEYNESLQLLLPATPKTPPIYHLIGKNYYMLGDFRRATDNLEKAAAGAPTNSEYFHWLGRAYGRRAETSSFLTAMGHATKARQNFERAVQLDPRNLEAVSDLFEYYLDAPGFLGGGLDKASALVERMKQVDPAEGYYAQARLAEKRKEFSSAEEHLRLAAEAAPHQVGRLIDLAKFLASQGKYQESEQNFQRAEQISPNNPKLLYARAETYIRTGRNKEVARKLLKQYLQAQLNPELPSRSEAEKLLQQIGG